MSAMSGCAENKSPESTTPRDWRYGPEVASHLKSQPFVATTRFIEIGGALGGIESESDLEDVINLLIAFRRHYGIRLCIDPFIYP